MSNTNLKIAEPLSVPDLELVYDHLAESLDRVGETATTLFLVKLALLCANALGDADLFRSQVDVAMQDLSA